jgi:hypothetical protein
MLLKSPDNSLTLELILTTLWNNSGVLSYYFDDHESKPKHLLSLICHPTVQECVDMIETSL